MQGSTPINSHMTDVQLHLETDIQHLREAQYMTIRNTDSAVQEVEPAADKQSPAPVIQHLLDQNQKCISILDSDFQEDIQAADVQNYDIII